MAASTKACNKCFTRAELSIRLLQAGCFLSNLAGISFDTRAGFRAGIPCICRSHQVIRQNLGEGMPRAARKLLLLALAVLAIWGQMSSHGGATAARPGS